MKYVLELCKIDVESMLLTFDDYLNYRVREHKILCVQSFYVLLLYFSDAVI